MANVVDLIVHQHVVMRNNALDWISKASESERLWGEIEFIDRLVGESIKVVSSVDSACIPANKNQLITKKTMSAQIS